MKIDANITELLPLMVRYRRDLHKIPEVGYEEFKTSAYLQKALSDIGYKFETVGTGIVVNIAGTQPKKTIGFRADIDGLKIEERTGLPFASQHAGYMHACGHDGHMAMLLGFAKYLKEEPPADNAVLVFQPAEEGGLGAKVMIDSGLIKADVFYALHLMPWLETGKFASRPGEMMAGAECFSLEFLGRGRHCMLHDGKDDAILTAAKFITEAEKLNSKSFIFNIGKLNGGSVMNAVAERVVAEGTMRFFNLDALNKAYVRLGRIIAKLEKQGVGRVKINVNDKRYLPLVNTHAEVAKLEKLEGYVEDEKRYGAEDFSLFTDKFGGAFVLVGCKTKEAHALHSDRYDFDENAMAVGVQVFKELLNA
jgi:amidohydrolase